jgi:chromosome segregation ATPase
MVTFLTILILASAFVAFIAAISALRAGLRLQRTRLALQSHFYSEVAQLADRATELEESLTALDARAQALPVRISDLQQNLATLSILTNALGISLRQAQKALSSTRAISFLTRPLSVAFGTHTARNDDPTIHGETSRS